MSLACSPSILVVSFDRVSLLTIPRVCCSLCLLPEYNGFQARLGRSLPLPDGPTLPTSGDEVIDAVLKVLQMERERRKADVRQTGEEDCNKMDDSIGASAADKDEDMVDTPVDEVGNALRILVHNATEEFGFAPRDVYNGVLNLPTTRVQHATAVRNLDCSTLKTLVKTFCAKRELDDFSSRVVVVYPVPFVASLDKWAIDFKSTRIGREVMERMWLKEDPHLWEMYDFLRHKSPECSALAGRVFKAMVHHAFSDGWRSGGPQPQSIPTLVSDSCDPFEDPCLPLPLSLVPKGESQHQWEMPVSWSEDVVINNRRGNAFGMRVPVSARHGMWCLFTPIFGT